MGSGKFFLGAVLVGDGGARRRNPREQEMQQSSFRYVSSWPEGAGGAPCHAKREGGAFISFNGS